MSAAQQPTHNKLVSFAKRVLPQPVQDIIYRIIHGELVRKRSSPINPKTPPEERKIFDLLKDGFRVVFDVGARNEISFYEMKPDCEYHLFEPNAQFVDELRVAVARLHDHHITVNPFGLSDQNADGLIYYEKSQSFIINPTYPDGDIDTGLRYSVRKLDDYVDEHHIPRIDFLKIDTEGLDYKVILGAARTIAKGRVSFIQFEYWDGVKKFVDLLPHYRLYLLIEPVLARAINRLVRPHMSPQERSIDFHKSLVRIDGVLVNLIDGKIIPTGNGANVLAVHRTVPDSKISRAIYELPNP